MPAQLSICHPSGLSHSQAVAIGQLLQAVWPHAVSDPEAYARHLLNPPNPPNPRTRRIIIWDEERALAAALIFPRTIASQMGELEVMALAGVCTHPNHRGRGLGAQLIDAAFREVDDGHYRVSLFQTGVPDFYRRWGAATVTNEFWDSTRADPNENPWWDEHIMIYPGDFPWPEGKIDLRGGGY